MNEILRKRIEEKYKELGQMFFPDNMNVFARPNWEAGYIETACKEIANFALQNQWISVDEGLPEKEGRYLCNYHHKFSNSDDECDCVDFGLFKDGKWYVANNEVTHWMPIPSLEGGEK